MTDSPSAEQGAPEVPDFTPPTEGFRGGGAQTAKPAAPAKSAEPAAPRLVGKEKVTLDTLLAETADQAEEDEEGVESPAAPSGAAISRTAAVYRR